MSGPAALGEARELGAQDLARRGDDRRAVLPLHVGQAQRGAVEPRRATQRVEVGLHDEVAVAALPARHRVAVDRVHLDVDREQVVAALGAVVGHRLQEPRRRQALALQAPLHVGQGQQHGVDVACGDLCLQLVGCHGRGPYLAAERPWRIWSLATPMPELAAIIARLEPELGALEGDPQPLDGGITNRNYRVRMGGDDLVLRLCDHGAEVLGIDRTHRGDRLAARRGRAHRARRWSPSSATCPRSSRAGCRAAASPPSRCARPASWRRSPRCCARLHATPPLPTAFAVFRLVEDQRGLATRGARQLRGHPRPVAPHRGGAHRPRARARLRATTTC